MDGKVTPSGVFESPEGTLMRSNIVCAASTVVFAVVVSTAGSAQQATPDVRDAEPVVPEEAPLERPEFFLGLPVDVEAAYVTGGDLDVFRYSVGTFVPLKGYRSMFSPTPSKTRLALRLRYQQDFLNDSLPFDVPSELYTLGTGLVLQHAFTKRWSVMALGNVGLQSDLDTTEDALRFTAFGVVDYKVNERLTLNFSVAFLDREDLAIAAGPGLDWRPNDNWRVLLRPPQARVSRRLTGQRGAYGSFAYVGVGFGGGSYAVERDDGTDDVITIAEIPLRAGVEKVHRDGRLFAEVGWVIGRRVEYESGGEDENLANGFVVRAGMAF